MTLHTVTKKRVADAMVRFPRTHSPTSRLDEIRAFFEDDHVHMALIITADRRLVTTIERPDLAAAMPGATPAAELGTLVGRTARPADRLDTSTAMLLEQRRRRLAVIDDGSRLLGLLCLKKDGTGYCSDEGIRDRANQARRSRREQSPASDWTAVPGRAPKDAEGGRPPPAASVPGGPNDRPG
jgi:CBS-domain-containing membrane protein